jgi:toxin ParE1/3/4
VKSRLVQPAELEVAEALEHYQQITTGLGERFLGEVRRAVMMVEQFPHNSPVIASDVRKKVLLEFPYTLFYRVTSDEIIFLAVAHQRQRPLYWRRRLGNPDAV